MKILIVEDEVMVARALKRMISGILGKRQTTLATSPSIEEAHAYLHSNKIDLLFLDLNLNGEDGMSLLADLTSSSFHTIIVSANTDQALRAFEYGVVDFVPKPFDEARLEKAIARLNLPETSVNGGQGNAEFLGVRRGGTTQLVETALIVSVKATDSYSELILASGDHFLHEKNLKQLIQILPASFQRIHRSTIVNMKYVNSLEAYEGSRYELRLSSGGTITVGRAFVDKLRERLP